MRFSSAGGLPIAPCRRLHAPAWAAIILWSNPQRPTQRWYNGDGGFGEAMTEFVSFRPHGCQFSRNTLIMIAFDGATLIAR